MLYAYIDESYRKDEVYLVGAFVVDRHQQDAVTFGLEDVAKRTLEAHPQLPKDLEFHGQALFQRANEWKAMRERPAAGYAIYRRALSRVASSGGRWFVAGVRRPDRLAIRYVDPWPPHMIALQYVLEMVDQYAESVNESVHVVADTVENQRMHEAQIRLFQDRGRTTGWKPRALTRIERDFEWVDSREHRALQACDMLTYVYLRKRFLPDAHHRTVKEVTKLRDIARPILHKERIWTP